MTFPASTVFTEIDGNGDGTLNFGLTDVRAEFEADFTCFSGIDDGIYSNCGDPSTAVKRSDMTTSYNVETKVFRITAASLDSATDAD
jgi:hypothetical protein